MYQMLAAPVNMDFLKTFTETLDGVIIGGLAARLKGRSQRVP
jgi:hypothetical protein